ncbi:hypothetical protein [Teichococcus aerofrigidensis]
MRCRFSFLPILAALACLTAAPPALAELYSVNVTVDGVPASRSYTDVQELQSVLTTRGIASLSPHYTNASAVQGSLSIRGLDATLSMARNSPEIRLIVPRAGIDRTFSGATREESQRQLRAFLGGSGDDEAMYEVADALVARTLKDPIAGNPGSLLGQSIAASHAAGIQPPGDLGTLAPRAAGWHFGSGFEFQSQRVGGTARAYGLPLAASYTFGADGPEAYLSLPLALNELEGARAYMGSAALGLRIPLIRGEAVRWALSPAYRYGAAGSYDSGNVAAAHGPSLTSDLRLALPAGLTLGIGNTYAYAATRPLEVGKARIDYRLDNSFYRNGVWLARGLGTLAGRPVTVSAGVTDTRVAGSRFAVPSWQEYRLSLSLGREAPVSATLAYTDGRAGYSAWHLGLAIAF